MEWNIPELKEANFVCIQRCYYPYTFSSEIKTTQQHSFSDASEVSYGVCVYIRCEHSDGVHCTLITLKTWVAKQTIPLLELLSSLLARKLTEGVKKALDGIKSIDRLNYIVVGFHGRAEWFVVRRRNSRTDWSRYRNLLPSNCGSTYPGNKTLQILLLEERQHRS